jgi:acetylornithine deacetylase
MENRLVSLLGELVAINSVNPTLSGGPGEGEIARSILDRLSRLGLEAELLSVATARANVVALVRGKGRSRPVLLNGHIDTVGVEGMERPFSLRREGDRLHGRGAYDMKGGVAVMLALGEFFARHRPPGDLWLTFSADEEDRSLGTEQLVRDWLPGVARPPAAGIFLEPTEGDIGVAHKGFTWFEIEIVGKAAHGSRPEQGIDAILPLRGALTELDLIRSELSARTPDPLLGRPSLHGGVIRGGTEPSVVPAHATLCWERRTLPEEPPGEVTGELARVAEAVAALPGGHRVRQREVFVRPPYRTPADAEIVSRLRKASPGSRLTGLSFWADSALLGLAGVPSVLFGPAGHGAHAVNEWVSLKSMVSVYETLKTIIGADA